MDNDQVRDVDFGLHTFVIFFHSLFAILVPCLFFFANQELTYDTNLYASLT